MRSFESWEDYLAKTTHAEQMRWVGEKARRANEYRWTLVRGIHMEQITRDDVWAVLEAAKGRCRWCGSLALEKWTKRPQGEPWSAFGRRVGTLDHKVASALGGLNVPENLAWSCACCNSNRGGYAGQDAAGYTYLPKGWPDSSS